MSKLQYYLHEFQRRHVVKAGIAYLVAAWLIIQVLAILFPTFEASSGAMKITVIILAVGFPIWLIISWIYDFSPEGIKKTEAVTFNPELSRRKSNRLNRFIIGGLAIAVVLLVFNSWRLSSEVNELRDDILTTNFTNSIAVLALEDRSPNKNHEYLSFGISEIIYNRLIKFKELKVTSPSSSFYYKDKDVSFNVIASELDVLFILEGSIMPIGENFRISLRLNDSKDNSAIWAKTYDVKKENILQTSDDLAQNIARYLKLTVHEKDIQDKKVDPEALDLYLKAFSLTTREELGLANIRKTDSMLQKALQVDSTYAPIHTWSAWSLFQKAIYLKIIDRNEGLQRALRSAKKAYSIDPEDVLALNWCSNLSWYLGDIEGYERYLQEMVDLNAMNSDVMHYRAWSYQRTNQIDKAYPFAKRAFELSPKNLDILKILLRFEFYYGNLTEAKKLIEKIRELNPESLLYKDYLFEYYYYSHDYKAVLELTKEWVKDPDELHAVEIWLEGVKGNLEVFETNFKVHRDSYGNDLEFFYYDTACVYALNGERDKAFKYLDSMEFDYYLDRLGKLFIDPDTKSLRDDPRWDTFLNRLGKEFNYNFNHNN